MTVYFRNHFVLHSKSHWGARSLSSSGATCPVPMQVDAVWRDKGQGKKDKGKDGKGKDKNTDTRGKDMSANQGCKRKRFYCDQVKHKKKDCQERNADMTVAQRDGRPFRRHEKEERGAAALTAPSSTASSWTHLPSSFTVSKKKKRPIQAHIFDCALISLLFFSKSKK